MSLKRHGKNNKPNSILEHPHHGAEFPSKEELVSQLAQLRSSLEGAYETLDSIEPSTDPEVTRKVADMVEIINGLHECEVELMDLLAKDGHVISPTPSRGGDNPMDKGGEEKQCDGIPILGRGVAENDANSQAASQEDLSLYGAYAVSSSRSLRNANELSKTEKPDQVDAVEQQIHIPLYDSVDYVKRLEEIQRVNERLVDRCRRLVSDDGLVLSRGFAMDKNMSSKIKEVKDIAATKEQAQRKILELKALMQQVTEEKLDADISLAKIENDESYGRPFRYEGHRLTSHGAASISPTDVPVGGGSDDVNAVKKPRSFLGIVDTSEPAGGPDYSQFLRGLRQPFNRENGERESAFVPIHNAAQFLDPTRDKNSNMGGSHSDLNNELKAPRATGNASLLRRVIEGGNQYPQNIGQLEHQRQARSSSARASLLSAHQGPGCNTLPNNLFRSNYSKSPPSMQSSGMGSMNSRSMASLENGRNELPYIPGNMSRISSRNHDPDDNISHRGFSERPNMSSNNLNKTYRQPTRSSSFYSELDFRNQEVFPTVGWDDDGLHAQSSPLRPRSPPEFRRRLLSSMESQQITDELNRVLRCRTSDESLPLSQQNWWSSSTESGQTDRHTFVSDHQNFTSRAKSLLPDRTSTDCYSQIMQLHVGIQEITQQIRNLNVTVAANKTATRDALLQHRFDLHNVTRCIRDVSDMISDSMKRMEAQASTQTRIIMDIESRVRRMEDNQRASQAGPKYESSREPREWQVPGRPDFMVSQDLSFQYGHGGGGSGGRDAMRERENGSSGSMLNNQIPPGTRANNYWDNFRSYSRQNMLSKSNANVPQQFSHEASPSSVENSRYTSSDTLNNSQPTAASASVDVSGDRRNSAGKNLWATSGFYENMSTKKRNKDQKAQQTSLSSSMGKSSSNAQSNSGNGGIPEPLRTPRDPHPEPDESSTSSINRHSMYSQLSPQISPFRRDPELSSYSRLQDFELSWPPPSTEMNRKKFESETSHQQPTEATNATESSSQQHRETLRERERETLRERENHFSSEDINPNSQSSAPKIDREKHIQNYDVSSRSSSEHPHHHHHHQRELDDTQSSNQELLHTTAGDSSADAPDWVLNAIDCVNATDSSYHHHHHHRLHSNHSPLATSPLIQRSSLDNNESSSTTTESNEPTIMQQVSSPPHNIISPLPPPPPTMNIRCEESALSSSHNENQSNSRSNSSSSRGIDETTTTTTNNNNNNNQINN